MKSLAVLFLILGLYARVFAANSSKVIVIEPRTLQTEWQKLNLEQRKLLCELSLATQSLRRIPLEQTHRFAVEMDLFFREIFSEARAQETRACLGDDLYRATLDYVLLFVANSGPYDAFENQKNMVDGADRAKLSRCFKKLGWNGMAKISQVVRLMADPGFESKEMPSGDTKLRQTGGNLYQKGITENQARGLVSRLNEVPSNARFIKKRRLALLLMAANSKGLDAGLSSDLSAAARHFTRARALALTDDQATQLGALSRYYRNGNSKDWFKADEAWVRDSTTNPVRVLSGFLFPLYDFMGRLSKNDSTVFIGDERLNISAAKLAKSVAVLEERLPYGKYRRKFPDNYAPAIYFGMPVERTGARETPGYHAFGEAGRELNLIPVDPPEAAEHSQIREMLITKFSSVIPSSWAEQAVSHYAKIIPTFVLMHEFIGHGSGSVDPIKYVGADPYSAMGPDAISLEEMRANLASIELFDAPEIVSSGLADSQATLRTWLQAWLGQYIAENILYAARLKELEWPHLRGGVFLITYWLEKGVLRITPDSKVELVSFDKLREVSRSLLEQVQLIRAERDETTLHELYAKYSPRETQKLDWVRIFAEPARNAPASSVVLWQPMHWPDPKKSFDALARPEPIGSASQPETWIQNTQHGSK